MTGTGEPGSFRAETMVAGEALWAAVEISVTDPATGNPVVLASGQRYVPPASESLAYDLDGNLVEDGRWLYTWDAENRLTGMEEKARPVGGGIDPASLPPRKRLTFAYDARHRRVAKWVHEWEGDETTGAFSRLVKDLRFLYDGWNVIAEFESSTGGPLALKATYARGLDVSGTETGAGGVGGLLFAKLHATPGTPVLAPCYDGNGNILAYVDCATGQTLARYEYDPFGKLLLKDEDTRVAGRLHHQFSTKYCDAETGLAYYGYRYYAPELGRWVNRDPIGERGGRNLYCFLGNRPISFVDVLGLACEAERQAVKNAQDEIDALQDEIEHVADYFNMLRDTGAMSSVQERMDETYEDLAKLGEEMHELIAELAIAQADLAACEEQHRSEMCIDPAAAHQAVETAGWAATAAAIAAVLARLLPLLPAL